MDSSEDERNGWLSHAIMVALAVMLLGAVGWYFVHINTEIEALRNGVHRIEKQHCKTNPKLCDTP